MIFNEEIENEVIKSIEEKYYCKVTKTDDKYIVEKEIYTNYDLVHKVIITIDSKYIYADPYCTNNDVNAKRNEEVYEGFRQFECELANTFKDVIDEIQSFYYEDIKNILDR